jgi:hypothetical protein
MSDKDRYTAEAHLTTDRDKEVVLRFTNLTIGEAKAFMRIFDKYDHVYSNVELNLHKWEKK